jgi:hypothetical protein
MTTKTHTKIAEFSKGQTPKRLYVGARKGCQCGCHGHYEEQGTASFTYNLGRLERMLITGQAAFDGEGQALDGTHFIAFAYGRPDSHRGLGSTITLFF